MILNIIFIGAAPDNSCSFTTNMILDVQIQQNVFALQKMSVNIIGQATVKNLSDKLLLKMQGNLKIKKLRDITIQNIEMMFAQDAIFTGKDAIKQRYFGI